MVIRVDRARYAEFYGVQGQPADSYPGTLRRTQEGMQLRFAAGATYPEPLATHRQGLEVAGRRAAGPAGGRRAAWCSSRCYFVKLNAIAAAALDFAKTAAEIALGLIGVLALFLGMLKIAEQAGVIYALVKLVRPVLRPIFPELPARPSRRWA